MGILSENRFYLNGYGDMRGPMEQRSDYWLDQYGCVFAADGLQVNHLSNSAGNIKFPALTIEQVRERLGRLAKWIDGDDSDLANAHARSAFRKPAL